MLLGFWAYSFLEFKTERHDMHDRAREFIIFLIHNSAAARDVWRHSEPVYEANKSLGGI